MVVEPNCLRVGSRMKTRSRVMSRLPERLDDNAITEAEWKTPLRSSFFLNWVDLVDLDKQVKWVGSDNLAIK